MREARSALQQADLQSGQTGLHVRLEPEANDGDAAGALEGSRLGSWLRVSTLGSGRVVLREAEPGSSVSLFSRD
jgi:hypothetical protein